MSTQTPQPQQAPNQQPAILQQWQQVQSQMPSDFTPAERDFVSRKWLAANRAQLPKDQTQRQQVIAQVRNIQMPDTVSNPLEAFGRAFSNEQQQNTLPTLAAPIANAIVHTVTGKNPAPLPAPGGQFYAQGPAANAANIAGHVAGQVMDPLNWVLGAEAGPEINAVVSRIPGALSWDAAKQAATAAVPHMKTNAAIGAAYSGMSDAAQQLQNTGRIDPSELLQQTVTGAGAGAGMGFAGPFAKALPGITAKAAQGIEPLTDIEQQAWGQGAQPNLPMLPPTPAEASSLAEMQAAGMTPAQIIAEQRGKQVAQRPASPPVQSGPIQMGPVEPQLPNIAGLLPESSNINVPPGGFKAPGPDALTAQFGDYQLPAPKAQPQPTIAGYLPERSQVNVPPGGFRAIPDALTDQVGQRPASDPVFRTLAAKVERLSKMEPTPQVQARQAELVQKMTSMYHPMEILQGFQDLYGAQDHTPAPGTPERQFGDYQATPQADSGGTPQQLALPFGESSSPKESAPVAAEAGGVSSAPNGMSKEEAQQVLNDVYQRGEGTAYGVKPKNWSPLPVTDPEAFQRVGHAREALGKEYWQRTRDQVRSVYGMPEETHARYVKQALEAGKSVPPEVLKDYPALENQGVLSRLMTDESGSFNPRAAVDWLNENVLRRGPEPIRPTADDTTVVNPRRGTAEQFIADSEPSRLIPQALLSAQRPQLEARINKLIALHQEALRTGNLDTAQKAVERIGQLRAKLDSTLRDATATTAKAQRMADRVASSPTPRTAPKYAGNVNLNRINTTDDVKGLIEETARQFAPEIDDARRGTIREEQLRGLADDLGMTPEKLLARQKGEAFNAEHVIAARNLLASSAENLQRIADEVRSGINTPEKLLELRHAVELHSAIQAQVSGMSAEAGRALAAHRLDSVADNQKMRAIQDMIDGAGGVDGLRDLADKIASLDNETQLNSFVRDMGRANFGDWLSEYWTNSVLSNPLTHAAYTIGNVTGVIGKLVDTSTAAAIGKAGSLFGRERHVTMGEAKAQAFAVLQGAREGLTLMRHAWNEERDPDGFLDENRPAIPGPVGKVVRLPSRAIQAKDAVFKGIFYRMELNGLAYRTAFKEGLRGQQLSSRVAEILNDPPQELMAQAIHDAHAQTYTNQLTQDSLVTKIPTAMLKVKRELSMPIQQSGNPLKDVPQGVLRTVARTGLQVLLPFVKLPTNVVMGAILRSPAALMNGEFYAAMGRGGADAEIALGHLALGCGILGSFMAAARSGLITGGGPSDPGARKMLQATGWQPYSFKVGDRYVAYNKLGSVGLLMGMSADLGEDKADPREKTSLLQRALEGAFKNLADESWLMSVSNAIDAFSDPDRALPRLVNSMASGFVPFSALSGRIAGAVDPTVREAQTPLDAMAAKVPGLSQNLPARLDYAGRPIQRGEQGIENLSPFYITHDQHDQLAGELYNLGLSPNPAPRSVSLGHQRIALTPEQQAAYGAGRGNFIDQVIRPYVAGPEYQALDDDTKKLVLQKMLTDADKVGRSNIVGGLAVGAR